MNIHHTARILLACALPALAATLHLPYTGGKQTGTLDIKGSYSSGQIPGADYPDTVVIDGALRVAAFTEESVNGRLGSAGYWLFLENSAGAVGFRNSMDTAWSETTTFPSTPLRLDSVAPVQDPLGRPYPANLSGKRFGLKPRIVAFDGEGTQWADSVIRVVGDNRTIYFRMNKAEEVRYGKLAVTRDSIYNYVNPIPGGNQQLVSLTLRYMMFSSAEYDSTPMALRQAVPPGPAPVARLVWSEREGLRLCDGRGRFYNLHGRQVPQNKP